MKIAIIGSRNIKNLDLEKYITDLDEIVSSGARGVDSIAAEYANQNGIKLTEFLPEYTKYGKAAPLIRNRQIVDYTDKILVFWDGKSKGTAYTIKYAHRTNKNCEIIII